MSLFNFRRAGPTSTGSAASAAQTESVDVVRRRAKHRLIGSAVLVLAGVLGFPLLFDTQPRPIAVDIPIEIPGKNAVKPLALPSSPPTTASAVPSAPAPAAPSSKLAAAPAPDKVPVASSLGEREEIVGQKGVPAQASIGPAATKNEVKAVAKAEVKPEAKVAAKPDTKVVAKAAESTTDGARAKALLEGSTQVAAVAGEKPSVAKPDALAQAVPVEGRVIVQVGAYADAAKAKEARLKLEKAGLKTYTQVADTADGKRTRVRVGPFANRAEAEKAASKIKTLDLPAAILTL